MTTSPNDTTMPAKVAIAMSGGVDSSVVAAMLKDKGHEVIGLTMLLQETDTGEDAISVAKQIGIEHHCIDLRKEFAEQVMGYFFDAYASGQTPSPCVKCNRFIKFGKLIESAKEYGAEALLTGHYAQRIEGQEVAELHMGTDLYKDQSYFLFALSQEQIDFIRFPLAEKTKDETRAIAEKYNLTVAQKADSQDICFVPDGNYIDVLKQHRPDDIKPGEIVDQNGEVLGQHKGVVYFTVGQRKGLNLGARTGDNNEPLFVLELDAKQKRVVVGPREALRKTEVMLTDVNWLATPVPDAGVKVGVRLRSSQAQVPATFFLNSDGAGTGRIVLDKPQYGVAKGQAGVIYHNSRVLGGGWISGAE